MTTTYVTTNIVIDVEGRTIWAEDFNFDTPDAWTVPFRDRAGVFIDKDHARLFTTMREFTEWLQERSAIVEECWILGATLSDEERVGR